MHDEVIRISIEVGRAMYNIIASTRQEQDRKNVGVHLSSIWVGSFVEMGFDYKGSVIDV